jgi:hypothetical protein
VTVVIFYEHVLSFHYQFADALGMLTVAPACVRSCTRQIRINFNITLLDLPCRFAVVDVLDVLGTNRMNVSKNIEKVGLPCRRHSDFETRNAGNHMLTIISGGMCHATSNDAVESG